MRRLADARSAAAALPLRITTRVQTRIISRLEGTDREAGMVSAEYAVATVAACGLGGALYTIVTSPQVLDIVKSMIGRAFKLDFG